MRGGPIARSGRDRIQPQAQDGVFLSQGNQNDTTFLLSDFNLLGRA